MERKHTYMATVMQIGQEMLILVDQHQAMYFSLHNIILAQSVGQVGNNPQLPSPQLKLKMMLGVQLHKKLYGYAL